MEKIIQITPAFDKRHRDPKQDYGIHGVDFRFILKGKYGATQFVIFSNWHLPHVRQAQDTHILRKCKAGLIDQIDLDIYFHPMPADKGYHSLVPQYDGQQKYPCDLFPQGCYYDGSGLNAQSLFDSMLQEGDKAIWRILEEYYNELFGDDK